MSNEYIFGDDKNYKKLMKKAMRRNMMWSGKYDICSRLNNFLIIKKAVESSLKKENDDE